MISPGQTRHAGTNTRVLRVSITHTIAALTMLAMSGTLWGESKVAAPHDLRFHAAKKSGSSNTGTARVRDRVRLGTYIEETAYVSSGPYAGQIVMISGNEIWGVPFTPHSKNDLRKLFDIRNIGISVSPKGMTHIASEGVFAFVSGAEADIIHITDAQGNRLSPRPIGYKSPNELTYFPHPEGLFHVPANSTWYPDHLLMVMNLFPPAPPYIESSLRILSRDGTLVREIRLPESLRSRYLVSVTLTASGRLLVGVDNEIWTLGLDGSIISGPAIVIPQGLYVEGLEQLPDGRICLSAAASLYFLDQNLTLQSKFDAGLGLHLIGQYGIAWNSDTQEHWFTTGIESSGDYYTPTQLVAMPANLHGYRTVFNIVPGTDTARVADLDYVPGERLIVSRGSRSREVAFLTTTGQIVERVDLSALGRVYQVNFMPNLQQFAVTVIDQPRIKFVTRSGVLVRELDLTAAGITLPLAFTDFNPSHPSGGQFLVFDITSRAIVIDFNGQVTKEFDYVKQLGVVSPVDAAPITNGPRAGAFSVLDSQNQYELVVFDIE